MKLSLHHRTLLIAAAFFLLLTAVSGCGRKDDLKKAQTVVETSLNSWKNGETPDKLVSQGIDITDQDWKAGNKLLDYSIKSAMSQPQQGPRVVVMLNMQTKRGKKVNTEVAYEVILTDKAKIGRDAFHVPQ